MTFNAQQLADVVNKAAEQTDMTKAQGGGDRPTAKEGPCRLRLVGYIETGKQKESFQGVPRVREKVKLIFEVSGKNHPPVEIDGKKYPYLIEVEETLSLNEKANFFKLFQRLNYSQTYKHFAQLLGQSFLGEIVHRPYKTKAGKDGVAVELKRKNEGYTIKPPRVQNPETDEWMIVEAGPQLTTTRCFLWNYADEQQWASIFIEGQYEERKNEKGEVIAPAKSKNKFQLAIRGAENFDGSPIDLLLKAKGIKIDLPAPGEDPDGEAEAPAEAPAEAAKPASTKPQADPLAGASKPAKGPAADFDDDIPF